MSAPPRATRAPHDPAYALWAVAGVCWLATVWLVLAGGHGTAHHGGAHHGGAHDGTAAGGIALGQPEWGWAAGIAAFLAVWLVMVGAMMLPTVVPMARLYVAVSARSPRPVAARATVLAGYLAVWTAFAVLAVAGAAGVQVLVDRWSWTASRPDLLLGAALVLAGAFQFTPLKNACLTACRNPVVFLYRHYRRGPAGGWVLGLRHGLSCLGCCWALMLVMVVTGVASLAWMLALTVVMVAEKTSRYGARLVAPVGVGLLVAGVVVAGSAVLGGP